MRLKLRTVFLRSFYAPSTHVASVRFDPLDVLFERKLKRIEEQRTLIRET